MFRILYKTRKHQAMTLIPFIPLMKSETSTLIMMMKKNNKQKTKQKVENEYEIYIISNVKQFSIIYYLYK